jgi:hypothetical protein
MKIKIGGSVGKLAEDAKKAVKKNPGAAAGMVVAGPLGAAIGAVYDKSQRDKAKAKAGQLSPADAAAKLNAERKAEYQQGRQFGQTVARDYTQTVNPAIASAKNAASAYAPDETFRQYQLGLAQQLQAQARGEGPSLAQMQLAQATDRSLQQALGAARSGLGSNPALAARTAALQASGTMGNAAAQSSMLRLQEQQDAQRALAGLSETARGADMTTASTRANLGMDASRIQGTLLGGAAQASAGIAGDAFGNRFMRETNAQAAADSRARERRLRNQKYEDAAIKMGTDGLSTAIGAMFYKGGMVPMPKGYACGGKVKMSEGGQVPAPRAKGGLPNDRQVKLKEGDHPENDIVPAMLSPGEIVIPRSKAKDPKKAAAFAAAIAKRTKKEA